MTPEQARMRLTGAMTALVTPFTDGEVDLKQLTTLLRWQIDQGINGLVPCGTTGEAPTLSWEERLDIIALCVKIAGGRVPIIAGTGTNSTETTIAFSTAAEAFGADAALIVTPYYNRPSQEGIFRHFEAVASKVRIPTDRLQRPGANRRRPVAGDASSASAQIPTIVGIKDATGDVNPILASRCTGAASSVFPATTPRRSASTRWAGVERFRGLQRRAPALREMHDACRQGDDHTARAIHRASHAAADRRA